MAPTSQTKPIVQQPDPAKKRDKQPVGKPIDASLLKQIGGGNQTPVTRW